MIRTSRGFRAITLGIALCAVIFFAGCGKKEAGPLSEGGEIKHEFTLIKGFTVEYPADHVSVLQSTEHIHVEQDGEVRTQ